MYKACALDPELCAMDASSRNLAYDTGFAYKRWKSGLNAMLEKIPGNFWLRKLRTIMLLEADGNMNFKKLSRDLMWVAEQAGLMVDGNYGGRKHHRAIEASLDFRLTNDLLVRNGKLPSLPPLMPKAALTALSTPSPSSAYDMLACTKLPSPP